MSGFRPNPNFMQEDVLNIPLVTGNTSNDGTSLPSSIFKLLQNNSNNNGSSGFAGLNNIDPIQKIAPKTGGFFGNGVDLGMNLDTAKFGFGALNSIMQLFGANEARKNIKAQTEFARRNLQNSELAYNDRVAFRGRMAEASKGDSTAASIANAESNYVNKYGTNGLLSRGDLRPRDTTTTA